MRASTSSFDGFRKRDGSVVTFDPEKIANAVQRASEAAARQAGTPVNTALPSLITGRVIEQLNDRANDYYIDRDDQGLRVPHIEDIQDLVEITLAEEGCARVVWCYKHYRKQRDTARRRIRVRAEDAAAPADLTDASLLLVESITGDESRPWDRARIAAHLVEKAGLSTDLACSVAKAVENHVIESGLQTVNSALVRELANNELRDRGYRKQLRDLSIYSIPREFVERLMFSKSAENSNIVNNNPEAVNLGIAELVLKQWALDTVFTAEVKRAHDTGAIHLHDLGYPHRVYCSSHSVEYVKKYGLRNLVNLNTESSPARSASVLTGHLNTFLASMQANYAGALGIAYINILYAPLLVGMDARGLKQVAQELIFNGSQNAFSRGGQTLFLDFNIHTGVPRYLQNVPALGPGGHYQLRCADGRIVELEEVTTDRKDAAGHALMELYRVEDGTRRLVLREWAGEDGTLVYDPEVQASLIGRGESVVTYGDYRKEAQDFTLALLDVWADGDRNGRVFEFPKCDFHISDETFTDPEQYEVFLRACELASRNGSTYFIFDRDEVTLSACCRLRTTVTDRYMLQHPESMRFCGFQNVTINIPQAAYRARRAGRGDWDGLMDEIDRIMDLAVEAHLQKKRMTAEMMSGPGRPLYQIGRPSCDGLPYVNLDECTYILGLIGVNDAVRFLTGQQLHESDDAMEMALRIVAHMCLRARKLSRRHGIKLTLEESPAESAARRLAKADLVFFEAEARATVKGDTEDVAYYTNSVHLAADAPVSLVERVRKQAMFHSMIESGAITHAFVGEEQPSAGAIAHLVEEAFFATQSAQLTISPEFTYCDDCGHIMRGLLERCAACSSTRVVGETRVVGYFSKVHNWNRSKREGELIARHRGRYSVPSPPIEVAAEARS